MLVQATVTKKETISKEIKTPYYAKEEKVYGAKFYRIGEDGSMLTVYVNGDYASISVSTENVGSTFADAVTAEPCSANEVDEACKRAVALMDKILSKETV
jgi:hypothetical protein